MELFLKVILIILIFLAVSSGITKIMLMPHDVEFFGSYGFSSTILILYGVSQLIGGVLLSVKKTRFIGAVLVAITFVVSAIVLTLAGNIPLTMVTLVAIIMLGAIMRQSFKSKTVSAT
jgi:hypothetical protein